MNTIGKKLNSIFVSLLAFSISVSVAEARVKKIRIRSDQFREMSFQLADQVKKGNFKPDVLMGLSRGGLTSLHYVSSEMGLDNRNVLVIATESYHQGQQRQVQLTNIPALENLRSGQNVLVIDDVLDTAKTMDFVLDYLNEKVPGLNIRVATVFYKPHASHRIPDFFVQKTDNVWIVFPSEYRGNPPLEDGEELFEITNMNQVFGTDKS